MGRVDAAGAFASTGGAGSGGISGSTGIIGANGAIGGTGGIGANGSGCNAQSGGRGGDGGNGGPGGRGGTGGTGGGGGAGAGGTIFLSATAIAPGLSINLAGGPGGQPGRLVFGDAQTGLPTPGFAVNPAQTVQTTAFVPTMATAYLGGSAATPNIVSAAAPVAGEPAMLMGPAPFGTMTNAQQDPAIAAAIAAIGQSAPADAAAVVLRFDTGPTGLNAAYNTANVLATADSFDTFVIVNTTGAPFPAALISEPIASIPTLNRTEVGGTGIPTPISLLPIQAWITLAPESAPTTFNVSIGCVVGSVTLPPTTGGVSVAYVRGRCCDSLDFNNDGNIEPGDVDAYFSILGEGPCVPSNTICNDLDFNNDGNIDPADVDAYFSVLGEGPCL
jgi:hypothetical protein